MMDSNDDLPNEEEKGILYEFITHAEWSLEPELVIKGDELKWKSGHSLVLYNFIRSKLNDITSCLAQQIIQLKNSRLSWQFARSTEGALIAVLQDNCFEIRSSKDDYSTIVGSNTLKKDNYLQWRKIAWSKDCNYLVIGYSDGSVDCFDATGARLFAIPSLGSKTFDLAEALVDMIFIDSRVKSGTKWACELILVNFKGQLRSYYISYLEYELSHSFNFKQSVTAIAYHQKFNVILCCGSSANNLDIPINNDSWNANLCGISTWRLLNDTPFYRQSLTIDEEKNSGAGPNLLHKIGKKLLGYKTFKDCIYNIAISPGGSLLASVHVSGIVSIWHLPSMRLWKKWMVEQQPKYERDSSSFGLTKSTNLSVKDLKLESNHICDLNWWSDKALIIGRYDGTVSVASVFTNLTNLLGNSVEWFDSQTQLSAAFDGRFLVLECDHQVISRRVTNSEGGEKEKTENFGQDGADESSNILKSALFYVTDIERFRPHRRKPKLVSKIYRLTCLKSTTPEELFLSKLNDDEYGEALALAQNYGLDCDLVFQRQWRKSGFSIAAIHDYLGKISKRSWVLHECLERVPEDFDAARALLEFGLLGTEINVLLNIGTESDIKFILNLENSIDDIEDYDDDLEKPTDADIIAFKREKFKQNCFEKVDFLNISLEQKHLCLCRIKLLQYLDRLTTYEVMLGGPAHSSERFEPAFFINFRSQPAVEATVEFARQNNWQGVSAMFTFHGKQTLPHRLAILSNFPETVAPYVYRNLLPEAGTDNKTYFIYKWEEEPTRKLDWVESDSCLKACGLELNTEAALTLYEERPSLAKYKDFEMSSELLSDWFIERSFEIEESCRLINFALDLIRLGIERNVKNLDDLHDDLITLEVLVYECQIDEVIALKTLQCLSNIDKLMLLMSNSSSVDLVSNFKLWALPFLNRCERNSPGCSKKLIRAYLLRLSIQKLDYCSVLFRSSPYQQHFLAHSTAEFIALALDCIYACEDNQLESVIEIFECLPHRGFGLMSKELEQLHTKVGVLEKHINAVKVLRKYGVSKSVAYLESCQKDELEIKNVFTLLTRISLRQEMPLGEVQLKELLEDILKLQSSLFSSVNVLFCIEIFAESLLSFGRKDYIQLACNLLQCKATEHRKRHLSSSFNAILQQLTIPRNRSVQLIISAARAYFNSASEMNDPIMDLARHCLQMIDDPDQNVLSELDLIDSLKSLSYFEISMLPLQIRLCKNRLELICQIFQVNPFAYRESQKLMTLAHQLRVDQDVKEWEEQILILIAKFALKANDFIPCYNACHQIMNQKYSKGWERCFDLGRCESFDDICGRRDLLIFASVYCPNEDLEKVLNIKNQINGYLIKQKMQNQLEIIKLASNTNDPDKSHAHSGMENLASKIQSLTSSTTKQALSMITASKIIKDASSWLSPIWSTESTSTMDDITSFNIVFAKSTVSTFYLTCFPDFLESPLSASYHSYALPRELPTISVSFHLISLIMLTWNDDKDKLPVLPEVMQQVAKNLMPLDSILGLACLLTVNDPVTIDECFKTLPNTDQCVLLAIYIYSLRICQLAGLVSQTKLFINDSETLFKRAERYARLHFKTIENSELKKYCEFLQYYVKKRDDFAQGKLLLNLGRGVDVARFGSDEKYRFETVLGLIMTTDDKIFKIAISLAERYEMNFWELYMTHLEYLFNEEEIKQSALEQRVTSLDLMTKVLVNEKMFKERMESRVYVTISGTNHNRLIYYYTLLQQCQPNNVDERLSLLKKLRPIAKGLDYVKLVNNNDSIENTLKPCLTSTNIKKFAKLAPQISKCCRLEVTASEIYGIFVLKCFTESKTEENQENINSYEHWISRYGICKDYFEFLNSSDFSKFIDKALFSDLSFDEIPQEARIEILNRSLKYSKQEFRRCNEGSLQSSDWEEVINFINQAKNHTSWLLSKTSENYPEDEVIREFVQQLRLAHSEDKLKNVLLQFVITGITCDTLKHMLSFCPPNLSVEIKNLISEAFTIVVNHLLGQTSPFEHLLVHMNTIEVIKKMLHGIVSSKINVISVDEIMNKLEALYIMESIPISIRLSLINLLEKFYSNNDSKLKAIGTFKIQVMINQTWPEIVVNDDSFECDAKKENILNNLLEHSDTLDKGKCVANILSSFPILPSEYSCDLSVNPWCRIMRSMLDTTDSGKLGYVVDCLRTMERRTAIDLKGIEPIFNEVRKYGSNFHTLKFCLLTKHESLHCQIIDHLIANTEEAYMELDEEICELLIERDLVLQTVPTTLFKPLVNYILKYKDGNFVKNMSASLRENGYILEAASLIMKITSSLGSLQTFSSGLGLTKRW